MNKGNMSTNLLRLYQVSREDKEDEAAEDAEEQEVANAIDDAEMWFDLGDEVDLGNVTEVDDDWFVPGINQPPQEFGGEHESHDTGNSTDVRRSQH